MGGTDASVFAIEGVPTLGFTTEDFKGYDFDYGEIWHTERDFIHKETSPNTKNIRLLLPLS